MPKIAKILTALLGLLAVVATGGFLYVKYALPNVDPAPEITIETTPERLQRGRYLAENVTACIYCHSDLVKKTSQLKPGLIGGGRVFLTPEGGFPGTIVTPNITPAALRAWSDGEIVRALRSGVDRRGQPLFPIMPYFEYRKMTEEDLFSVVSYIKSLPAITAIPARSELQFPLSLIVHLMPGSAGAIPETIDTSDPVSYGEYLVEIAACAHCHTPNQDGRPDLQNAFSGAGLEFIQPNGTLLAPNITPHPQHGIGNWSREVFIARFKAYQTEAGIESLHQQPWNTEMPWEGYSGMTEDDLSAIYDYLRTLRPIDRQIDRWSPN